MDSVEVIPSSIDVGKAEMVVVIFPCDLPQDQLITLELKYNKSSRKSSWSTWVPGAPLGLKCLRAQLPAIPHPGEVEVSVKVSRVAFSLCPKFQLHVRSPVETIFHSVVTSRQGSTGTALACIAAYLLHTHEKDLTTIAHNDTTVCRALKSQPSFISEWNLSSLIFGKYGSNESLLHLFVRCKLDGAASLLLEKTKGKNNILQQQDYRGRTPAEIARKKGSKRVAEMVDEAITKTARSTNYEYRDPTGKLKKSKSLEQEQLHGIFSSDEDIGPLPIQLPTKQTGVWQKFKKQSKLSNDKKGSSPASQPSTPTHSEDIHPEAPPSNALPLPPRSPWSSPVPQDPAGQQPQTTAEPLQQLLSRCLYQASVLREYSWENSPFGDKVSLKRGDIVYVIKDLGNDFCQGVCNNFYCTVPKYILANDDADDDYIHMSPVDSSDYEEIDEDYDIPGPAVIQPTPSPSQPAPSPSQPAPLDTQADSITERQFNRPPMRPAIKTQAFKPPAVPGRLLPDCIDSSSHDTGLDRLGLPRQVSKSKIPNQLPPLSNQSKRAVVPDSSQLETQAPNDFRSVLKPAKRRPTSQKEPVASPLSESEDEYDDASSVQQYREQQQQRPSKPPVKTPVSRAVSLGGQPSRIRPAIKPRTRSTSSENSKTKPPSPLPRVKRDRPVKEADGSASPSVSDRRKMFERN